MRGDTEHQADIMLAVTPGSLAPAHSNPRRRAAPRPPPPPAAPGRTVVPTSGQLRARSGVTYDHEARARYEVTVGVSDGEATASIDVTIEVTDVDEPPDAPDAPTMSGAAASPSTCAVPLFRPRPV